MHKILIINNSFIPTQIILASENGILFSVRENPPTQYPNNILFIVEQFFRAFRIQPKDITEIAVTCGPGSFTGTRIGVVEGKIIAYALKIPLITMNSLDIIGKQIEEGYAAIFAGRMEVFLAKFKNGTRQTEDMCIPVKEAEKLENLFFPSREEALKAKIKNAKYVNGSENSIFEIVLEKLKNKDFANDPLAVNPVYLRSTDVIFKKKNENKS